MTKLIIFMISMPLFSGVWQQKPSLLDKRFTITFYAAEILESVIMRIEVETGQHIRYNTLMLLPYKAKARDYKNISVKDILDDQLSDTPIKYQAGKKQLELYNALTGDYSANTLSPVKN